MTSYVGKSVITLVAGTAIAVTAAGPASAATQSQRGLVNVAVGDVSVLNGSNVSIGVAAQIAAAICGVKVGPVAVLGTAVDASGTPATVCTTSQGLPVTITQA